MINYGVVGVGYFGAELARIMKKENDAKIVSVFDPENGEKIAQELGCDAEQSLDSLVSREDIDCVIVCKHLIICTKNQLSKQQNMEKTYSVKSRLPFSYKDCDEMVRACEENNVIFMAGHIMNFFHGVHYAKELINKGKIGKVLYCHSARNGWEDVQPSISWKKSGRNQEGISITIFMSWTAYSLSWAGMPEEVTMEAGNVAHQGEAFGDEDDMLFITARFSDGRYAVMEWGSAFHWPEHYLLIQGTKGAIKLDMFDAGGTLESRRKRGTLFAS